MLPIPRVPGATERARHQNDRTRELLKFVYVNRRCLACESRESRASAVLLLLLTSRCTHASESWPATGVSPLASATRWGSTPQRASRGSNHRGLSRTLAMTSIALAFSSPFLPSDALTCSCRLMILVRAHHGFVSRSRALGTSSFQALHSLLIILGARA